MTAILVTRPAGQADPLVKFLHQMGYRVHAVPTVQIEPIRVEAGDLAHCDWIVLTSVNGVDALSELPIGPEYAAVGEKTASALQARGIEPAHIPPHANGIAMAETLPNVEGKRIALVRASAADSDLPERLRRRGAVVDEITAYRTIEAPAASAEPLRVALADVELAAVVFASGSAVRGYLALGGTASVPAITIGPRTTAGAVEHGFQVIAEAEAQSAEGLASAVGSAVTLKEKHHA
jgi:uroporphyrinogen III methyltransferase/synthase